MRFASWMAPVAAALILAGQCPAQGPIIYDTDFATDCDDVGALAILTPTRFSIATLGPASGASQCTRGHRGNTC